MATQLPRIKDIYELDNVVKQDKLMVILNQPPAPQWVKDHPYIQTEIEKDGQKFKVPYKYLPIERVEFLLKTLFKRYRIEITGQGTAFNGVWVTVRVHFLHPISGEWDFHDGIGASQLQTKKGASPADLANINNGALSMAFPNAKTIAIKDACDHFGKLFGSDLNRKDVINYAVDLTLTPMDENHPNWGKVCEAVKNGYSIDEIKEKYSLSSEVEEKLNQFAR